PPGGIMRSTYTLAPFTHVEDIRLRYNTAVRVNTDGSLGIMYGAGQLNETAPIAWQEIDGARVAVSAAFVTRGEREVGFALGESDARYAITIDPTLMWSTFFGSSGSEAGNAIAIDGNGNVYISGSDNAPWGSPKRAFSMGTDAFVAKLDSNGNLLWN